MQSLETRYLHPLNNCYYLSRKGVLTFIVHHAIAVEIGFFDHLVDLVIRQFLAQVCHDMPQLCRTDKPAKDSITTLGVVPIWQYVLWVDFLTILSPLSHFATKGLTRFSTLTEERYKALGLPFK